MESLIDCKLYFEEMIYEGTSGQYIYYRDDHRDITLIANLCEDDIDTCFVAIYRRFNVREYLGYVDSTGKYDKLAEDFFSHGWFKIDNDGRKYIDIKMTK